MNNLDIQKENILIITGSFNEQYNQGISIYCFNTEEKSILSTKHINEVVNPIHMQFSKNGKNLYAACAQTPVNGIIAAFEINHQTADLSLINIQDSRGTAPCFISIDTTNSYVFAANYGSGNFICLPIMDNGGLNSAVQSIQHEGHSIHPERQTEPHIHCILTEPNNQFIFAVDLGTDEINSYRFSQGSGSIQSNSHSLTRFTPGSGPRHMVFHPKKPWVYIIAELSNKVHCFHLNKDGNLIAKKNVNTLPENVPFESFAADIIIDPTGAFLYVSNRGHDSISIFRISERDGDLKFIKCVSSEGKYPWSLNMDIHGNYVIVANQNSNNIVILKRNLSTGLLTKYAELKDVISPVSVKFLCKQSAA